MKTTFHKSWFTFKPQVVKFSKAVCTLNYDGHGITGGDLYYGKSSLVYYCVVLHFLWWSVKFDLEEKEGWGDGFYEKQCKVVEDKEQAASPISE